jgi:DNA-binding transcriptional LysR family regulator
MYAVDDMTVFARVVERASLSAAGRELRLSPAVVSSRITKLEARLGVRLLNRTTRTVNPTEEGRLYYEHCLRILAEIAASWRKRRKAPPASCASRPPRSWGCAGSRP